MPIRSTYTALARKTHSLIRGRSEMLWALCFLVLLVGVSANRKMKKKCSLKGGGYYGYELSRPVELDTGDPLDWVKSAGKLIRYKEGNTPSGTFEDAPTYEECRKICERKTKCIAWEGKLYRIGGPGEVRRYCALYSKIYGRLKKTRCWNASCSHAAGKCTGA